MPSYEEYFSAYKMQKIPKEQKTHEDNGSEFSQAIDIGVDSENEGLQK